jgi:DNA-binding beta-propeller fold protein YncE
VSPDGANVYVASRKSDGVAVFRRDPATGALTQLPASAGCITKRGAGGCARGRALNGARSIAVDPTGRNVYVASDVSDGVAVFRRDSVTGALSQLPGQAGCVTRRGPLGGECDFGRALNGAHSVAVTRWAAYVASGTSGGVAFFSRSQATGKLTQLGCATWDGSGAVCAKARAVKRAESVAVIPGAQSESVYIARPVEPRTCNSCLGPGGLAIFTRSGGTLTQLPGPDGCFTYSGSGGACTRLGLDPQPPVAVSRDGESVYVGYLVFARATNGALIFVSDARPFGPSSRLFAPPRAVAVSADGANVYVADDVLLIFARAT